MVIFRLSISPPTQPSKGFTPGIMTLTLKAHCAVTRLIIKYCNHANIRLPLLEKDTRLSDWNIHKVNLSYG